MRVAVRRLRSALRTHQDVIDPATTAPARAELTALGTVLGEARDMEVLRDRVVLSVWDDGHGIPPIPAAPLIGPLEFVDTRARGLDLVARLSTRMLVDAAAGRVTCEFSRRPAD